MEDNDKLLDKMFDEKKKEDVVLSNGRKLRREIDNLYEPDPVPVPHCDMDPPDARLENHSILVNGLDDASENGIYEVVKKRAPWESEWSSPHPTRDEEAMLKAPDYNSFLEQADKEEKEAMFKAPDYARFGIEFDDAEDEEWLAKDKWPKKIKMSAGPGCELIAVPPLIRSLEDRVATIGGRFVAGPIYEKLRKEAVPDAPLLSDEGRDHLDALIDELREERENEVVSVLLDQHDNTGSGVNMIAVARKFMWHMMTEYNDDGEFVPGSFYDGYRANVAMMIYDHFGFSEDHENFRDNGHALESCRDCADKILRRVFD